MNAREITIAVVKAFFSPREFAVCPNVSFGMLPYEADIIAISKGQKIHEIEVKISKSDLKNDEHKRKWAWNGPEKNVDAFWYAVPLELKQEALQRCQKIRAGLFVCWHPEHDKNDIRCERVICPKGWKRKTRFDINSVRDLRPKIWRLCSMRFWAREYGLNYGSN